MYHEKSLIYNWTTLNIKSSISGTLNCQLIHVYSNLGFLTFAEVPGIKEVYGHGKPLLLNRQKYSDVPDLLEF